MPTIINYTQYMCACRYHFNPYPAKLNNYIFNPLKVVSRYSDPQLQVVKITDICLI